MAENIVRHLGVIMDGNRRWARKHMFTSVMRGHEKGVDTFMDICTLSARGARMREFPTFRCMHFPRRTGRGAGRRSLTFSN